MDRLRLRRRENLGTKERIKPCEVRDICTKVNTHTHTLLPCFHRVLLSKQWQHRCWCCSMTHRRPVAFGAAYLWNSFDLQSPLTGQERDSALSLSIQADTQTLRYSGGRRPCRTSARGRSGSVHWCFIPFLRGHTGHARKRCPSNK